jgi:hypothetical protein
MKVRTVEVQMRFGLRDRKVSSGIDAFQGEDVISAEWVE